MAQNLDVTAPRASALNVEAASADAGHPKLANSLVNAVETQARQGDSWRQSDSAAALLRKGDHVLVEIRLQPGEEKSASRVANDIKGFVVYNHHVPSVIEAWVPVDQLEALAADPSVGFVQPAIQVQLLAGSVNTQEVASSLAGNWHTAAPVQIRGTGIRIGNIDGGYLNFAAAQAAGNNNWPVAPQLTTINMDAAPFGQRTNHGTATVEINHDMAPGSPITAYETLTVADWYNALVRTPADGVRVASVSLGALLNGVGDGSNCPPHFPAPCGTIAEASGIARAGGVLVVNAAGNERNRHWGGLYVPHPTVPTTHNFGTAAAPANVLQTTACLPAGSIGQVTLHWDDWTNVNHNYNLRVVRLNAGPAWGAFAASSAAQNGGIGVQRPQEFIQWAAAGTSPGCPANFSNYGFVIDRVAAATNRNLQLFSSLPLFTFVPARSLGFPADSPNVFTVAAVDQATRVQEVYSSEGPVLGAGGSLAASAIQKPNATSVANVATFSSPGFNGTSSATPHVAGIAALLAQFNRCYNTPARLEQALHLVAARNNLGAAGFDTLFGHGLVRFIGGPATFDADGDGIRDDGNNSGLAGDALCPAGVTVNCDDNCPGTANPTQVGPCC